ncbi:MAG TPA: tripartite tricarboxylate transporter substrate-binding protein, partial [Xanthobacteraceae bacterium]|nr:tripartite tricarboxylate transporter substrate-binding protein [Xanthobacteraceae bacterium]
ARRTLLKAAGAAAATFALPGLRMASAQGEKPVSLIIGFPPGSGIDSLARMIAEKMRVSLNRPVIVENRVGAAGRLAGEYVKGQPGDGSALLVAPMALMTIFPHTYRSLRYDPVKDFAPVTHLGAFGLALAVRTDTPVKTLIEYVDLVRKDSSANTYGSTGVGTPSNFFMVMFERTAGIKLLHVPFKGSADVLNNILGGHIGAAILSVSDIAPQTETGKLRAIAVSAATREPTLPNVPTFKEQGYDMEGSFWYGIYAPAATPKDVIGRLNTAISDAVRSPDITAWATKAGINVTGGGPDMLAAAQKTDFERWGPVIKASGFVADD